MVTTLALDPASLAQDERDDLELLAKAFLLRRQLHSAARLQFLDHDRAEVTVPREVADLIADILGQLAAGRVVAAYPLHAELTTQQAADFLNVSRPYVVMLVEQGELPHRKVGTHRRLLFADVLAYKRRQVEESRAALDELAHLSEELGLYEDL